MSYLFDGVLTEKANISIILVIQFNSIQGHQKVNSEVKMAREIQCLFFM